MKNYHVESLKEEIMPVIHRKSSNDPAYVLIKVKKEDLAHTLKTIRKQFASIDPDYIFNYQFIDDSFDQMYKEEERMHKTSIYSSLIAIMIALMGLYALTSFTVIKRRKEIGVRKAMGASVKNVVMKLIKDINKWVLIANVFSWPLVFYFMQEWLSNFAFRIDITVWYFLAGSLITFVFALGVVGSQVFSAATENPALTLRDE